MEAELVAELPTGDWQYEPKWDGFRGVLENLGGDLRLWCRNGRPLLRYFPELEGSASSCRRTRLSTARSSSRAKGGSSSTSFRCGSTQPRAGSEALGGDPGRVRRLRHPGLEGRAAARAAAEEAAPELERKAKRFRLSPAEPRPEQAKRWLERLDQAGLDGVVAKRLEQPYLPGSREGVVKVKPYSTADCVIVGFRWSDKGKGRISTLLLGLYGDDGELDFVGHCSGFPAHVRRELEEALPKLQGGGHLSDKRIPGGQSRWSQGEGARLESGQAEARRRGALRQARRKPLPARHEVPPLPARQGSTRVHLGPGARRSAAAATRPSRACSRPASAACSSRPGRSPSAAARPLLGSATIDGSPGSSSSASKRGSRLALWRQIPAVRSPTLSRRLRIVLSVNRAGSQRGTSFQASGAEARASASDGSSRRTRSSGRASSGRSRRRRPAGRPPSRSWSRPPGRQCAARPPARAPWRSAAPPETRAPA